MRLIDADKAIEDIGDNIYTGSKIRRWLKSLPSAQPEPEAISEWKKEFREYVGSLDIARDDWKGIIEYIGELPSAQPETNCSEIPNNWIPCSKRMPEEHEWIGTKRFGTTISDEVYVTFEAPDGQRFTDHISFQNGKLSRSDEHRMKVVFKGAKPIAWMPLPEPWKGEEDEND